MSLFWSQGEKRRLSNFVNTMPSVLLLFLDQNEGYSKSQVRKNCAVVDTILQRLSRGKEAFRRHKVWLPSRLRDIHVTADGNKITAHACCHTHNPLWGRVLLRNYFRLSSSKCIGEHPQISPRSAQNLAQTVFADSNWQRRHLEEASKRA